MINVFFVKGATCPDGSTFRSVVAGSQWTNENGIWFLVGCPPGYTLSSQQCKICPGGAYCTGGSIPATPCASGLYSLPGAKQASVCFPAVFVIVTITVSVLRSDFSDEDGILFQNALASLCGEDPGYVVIEGVAGDAQTTVTCNIATMDAKSAAQLARTLSSEEVEEGMTARGFSNALLESVKVTGCLPGFELLETQTCLLCPAASFCTGGSRPSVPCIAGYYSFPGSNSSSCCNPAVFVTIVASLSMTSNNFTGSVAIRFQTALAEAAGASVESVLVVSTVQGRRSSEPYIEVTAEIAASDASAAENIVSKISPTVLNSFLLAQGLPSCSLKSVSTAASNASGQGAPLASIVAAIIGGFAILFGCFATFLFRKVESEDERELRCTIQRLRAKIHITAQDGYLVGYGTKVKFLKSISSGSAQLC